MSPTTPYNDGFETLGYDSSEPIGLFGTINFLLAIMILRILWFFVPRKHLPCMSLKKKPTAPMMTNTVIRFFLQVMFEMFICVAVVFYQWNTNEESITLLDYEKIERKPLDEFSIVYASLIAVLTGVFLIFTAIVTICCSRKTVNLERQIREKKMQLLNWNWSENKRMTSEVHEACEEKYRHINKADAYRKIIDLRKRYSTEREKLALVNELFSGIVEHGRVAQLFNLLYVSRRLLLVIVAVTLQEHPM